MADINIVQPHDLSPEHARAAAQRVADRIAQDYGVACEWKGDVLHFERSGVHGSLRVEARQVALVIRLGMMMRMFSATIEAKVTENMRKVFGATA
jgi:putative polyhydroxyalkanoate system protein